MIVVDIVTKFLNDKMKLPEYFHDSDGAVDLQANLEEPMLLSYGEQALIPTGVYIGLPHTPEDDFNWCMEITPRSGLANKSGITITNSPGLIDAGYRAQVFVILKNTKQQEFTIEPGDRIAQMKLTKTYKISWNTCSELTDTDRGLKGLGSTGVK